MKTLKQQVISVLETDGPSPRQYIAASTGMSGRQADGVLFRMRQDGLAIRENGVWSLTAQPANNGNGIANRNGQVTIGDLFEVAGTLSDGTWTIRSLEAPWTIYALKEV